MLKKAYRLAKKTTQGKYRRNGAEAITHPLAVASSFDKTLQWLQAIALLHDVCEDSETTPYDLLKMGFPEPVVNSVRLLTRRKDQTYEEYIEAMLHDGMACLVKSKDINDNIRGVRIEKMQAEFEGKTKAVKKAKERINKYEKALQTIRYGGNICGPIPTE